MGAQMEINRTIGSFRESESAERKATDGLDINKFRVWIWWPASFRHAQEKRKSCKHHLHTDYPLSPEWTEESGEGELGKITSCYEFQQDRVRNFRHRGERKWVAEQAVTEQFDWPSPASGSYVPVMNNTSHRSVWSHMRIIMLRSC